jgi:hypothetical protein
MDSVVKFSVVASCACHAAYARLVTGQRTTKGWLTDVDQLIASNGLSTTLYNLGGGGAPLYYRYKCSLKTVKGTQYKLEYASFIRSKDLKLN